MKRLTVALALIVGFIIAEVVVESSRTRWRITRRSQVQNLVGHYGVAIWCVSLD
jgi:hypothetical protein